MSTVRPAARAARIKPFIAMEVMKAALELENAKPAPSQRILHLEIGQPHGAPPKEVVSALATCPPNLLGYTPALGSSALRKAIVNHYERMYDVRIGISDVAVGSGASGAFLVTFAAAFDAGDRVAISSPGYPCYRRVLSALDVQCVIIETDFKNNFQPTVAQLREAHVEKPLAGVVLASPANPTGATLLLDELEDLATFCRDEGIKLIVDEVYHGISRKPIPSVLQVRIDGATIIAIGSLSKYWCMSGFRIGWIVTRDKQLMMAIDRCLQNMMICAPTPCQHAAVAALSGSCDTGLNARVRHYFDAADQLSALLTTVGFDIHSSTGAFFVYAGCRKVCDRVGVSGATQLCAILLRECGVACTPGVDFDENRGEGYVRLSCSQRIEDVIEAGERITRYVERFPVKI